MRSRRVLSLGLLALGAALARAEEAPVPNRPGGPSPVVGCVGCHEKLEPGIVADWRLSKHARLEVGCEACHGSDHTGAADAGLARLPTVETCQACHELEAAQFRRGTHARAWSAVKALPTFHHLGLAGVDDAVTCAICHRIGLTSEAESAALRKVGANRGQASCDACHTRHLFSPQEARQPDACKSCHGGLEYDAWAGSKHGIRYLLKASGRLPALAAAPTCQTCHMQNGDHANRTPLGNLALRLPLPEDKAWAADVQTLFVALGFQNASGAPGPRAEALESTGLAHLDRIDYQNERFKLAQACRQCHATRFIREELDLRDAMVRRADALTASAVREVAALFDDGLLMKRGPGPFPDLVTAPRGSLIERRLATMFFDHRARLLATAFHLSPEAATWMSAVEGDRLAVKRLAEKLRGGTASRQPGAKDPAR
jgi:hydroxylamine dehydrogenase